MTGARWHGDCDREAVPGWHTVAYFTLFFGTVVEVPIQGSDDETDRPQAIVNIWEDLKQGTFLSSTSIMDMDKAYCP